MGSKTRNVPIGQCRPMLLGPLREIIAIGANSKERIERFGGPWIRAEYLARDLRGGSRPRLTLLAAMRDSRRNGCYAGPHDFSRRGAGRNRRSELTAEPFPTGEVWEWVVDQ